MKKILAIIAVALPLAAGAQSAIDAMSVTQSDFRGTARFLSMGGAFTALGGDLSTLNQNPAGIGVYRRSEVGVTIDLNPQQSKTDPAYGPQFPSTASQTKFFCNNFGYVGAINLGGALRTFNFGVTYNKAASFDRVYRGYVNRTNTSLTNYIAAFTDGTNYDVMNFDNSKNYNPYFDSDADWMSILAYNAYMINPVSPDTYQGLSQGGTVGDAMFNVRETGGIDEYDISFGGNVENLVYWGLSIGINDLKYTRTAYYSESMDGSANYNPDYDAYYTGTAGFDLYNRKYINGSGWNIKFGLIVKPVNEFRIGLAIHSPTWYHLNQGYDAEVDYSYFNPAMAESKSNPYAGNEYTEDAYFDWRLRSPWRFMIGAAGVIGNNFIISADYQMDAYDAMRMSLPTYGQYYDPGVYEEDAYLTEDIKTYFRKANTVRLGAEYRVTPQFSIRAGYNVTTSNVKDGAASGYDQVYTSGTDPSYSFNKNTQHISFGLGYKYQAWYIDAAYVYKSRESTYHGFTNFDGNVGPQSKIVDHNHQIVLSTGIRF